MSRQKPEAVAAYSNKGRQTRHLPPGKNPYTELKYNDCCWYPRPLFRIPGSGVNFRPPVSARLWFTLSPIHPDKGSTKAIYAGSHKVESKALYRK